MKETAIIEIKLRYPGGPNWENIEAEQVTIEYDASVHQDGLRAAYEAARKAMRKARRVDGAKPQVRWNQLGSSQGHYLMSKR